MTKDASVKPEVAAARTRDSASCFLIDLVAVLFVGSAATQR